MYQFSAEILQIFPLKYMYVYIRFEFVAHSPVGCFYSESLSARMCLVRRNQVGYVQWEEVCVQLTEGICLNPVNKLTMSVSGVC